MRIGIVLTVKNEDVLLPLNIEFHRLMGVNAFYIYYDHGSQYPNIPNLEDCEIHMRPSVSQADFTRQMCNRPAIRELLTLAGRHHTARQMLNAHHAILLARDSGVEWMISIDADEIVYPFEDIRHGQSLKDFFGCMQEANSIRFLPVEVCPSAQNTGDPFCELTFFLNIFIKENGEYRANVPITRKIYDPYKKAISERTGYLGHKVGKVAIRPELEVEPYTVHNFRFLEQSQSSQINVLGLLHYNHFSFEDFLKKYQNFRNRPDFYAYGEKVEYMPKLLWRDMVSDKRFTRAELRAYYNSYIAFPDDEIGRLKATKPSPIIAIKSPRELLRKARSK